MREARIAIASCLTALFLWTESTRLPANSKIRVELLEIIDEEGQVCARLPAYDGYPLMTFFDHRSENGSDRGTVWVGAHVISEPGLSMSSACKSAGFEIMVHGFPSRVSGHVSLQGKQTGFHANHFEPLQYWKD